MADTTEAPAGKFTRAKYMQMVRGLLAKANDPATPPEEADALTERAMLIQAKYGFQVAADVAAGRTEDPIADYVMPMRGSYLPNFVSMLVNVGKVLGLRMIRINNQGTSCEVHIFGPQSTIERVDMLFTSLVIQAGHGLTRERPAGITGRNLLWWRKDFIMHFSEAVCERLRMIEARAAAEAAAEAGESDATALVVADRAALTERKFKEAYPRVRTSSIGYGRSQSGAAAGTAAGQRADLGQTRSGGTAARAITAG